MTLYGFATPDERELFDLLTGVTGVGPKVALSFLSALTPDALRRAVVAGDADALTVVPGVGKKVAQRVVLDLRDRLGGEGELVADGAARRRARGAAVARPHARGGERGARRRRVRRPRAVEELLREALQKVGPLMSAGTVMDDDRLIEAAVRRPRGPRVRRRAAPADPRRVRRAGAREGAARAADRRGPRAAARPSTTCCSAARRGSARPRSPRSWRTRWAPGSSRRAGPALDRPSDLAAILTNLERRRRAVRRRDPPDAAGRRGGPVPGARGLQPRRRARQGADGAVDPPGAAAVHAGGGHDPARDASRSRSASGSGSRRASTTTRSTSSRMIVGRSAGILGVETDRGRRRRDRVGGRGARRGSRTGCCAGCATSPRSATTARSPATSRARASRCSRSTRRAWTGSTTRSCTTIVTKFGGGPVGLSTLAAAVGEETDTVEDVVEPYLLQLGFLQRTPRGRVATPSAPTRTWA